MVKKVKDWIYYLVGPHGGIIIQDTKIECRKKAKNLNHRQRLSFKAEHAETDDNLRIVYQKTKVLQDLFQQIRWGSQGLKKGIPRCINRGIQWECHELLNRPVQQIPSDMWPTRT